MLSTDHFMYYILKNENPLFLRSIYKKLHRI